MRFMFQIIQVTWGAFCLYALHHAINSIPKELTLLQIQDYIAFAVLSIMIIGALLIVAVAHIYTQRGNK